MKKQQVRDITNQRKKIIAYRSPMETYLGILGNIVLQPSIFMKYLMRPDLDEPTEEQRSLYNEYIKTMSGGEAIKLIVPKWNYHYPFPSFQRELKLFYKKIRKSTNV